MSVCLSVCLSVYPLYLSVRFTVHSSLSICLCIPAKFFNLTRLIRLPRCLYVCLCPHLILGVYEINLHCVCLCVPNSFVFPTVRDVSKEISDYFFQEFLSFLQNEESRL
jgi:hypothetical protein